MADIERYTVDSYNREKQRTTRKHCLRYADQGFSIFNQDMSDEERELLSAKEKKSKQMKNKRK